MTDKQIIIDGCDVSRCECIIEDYQRANNFEGRYEHIKNVCELGERGAEYYNLFCKDNPNCYYKQLKRAETQIVDLNKMVHTKEQECEKLKKENHIFEDEYKILEDNLDSRTRDFEDVIDSYKQTLAEIKEIAITGLEGFCPKCSRKECEDNNCIETAIRDILQKISEVESEEI